jgi:death on curing protein
LNPQVVYLTLEQILVIHQDQIDRYGGSHGIRELALLESAAFRPQSTFSNLDLYPELFDKAAALMHSLILNHPFIDGNKRTGSASTLVFLEVNGFRLKVGKDVFLQTVLDIESKKMTIEDIAQWLKINSEKI